MSRDEVRDLEVRSFQLLVCFWLPNLCFVLASREATGPSVPGQREATAVGTRCLWSCLYLEVVLVLCLVGGHVVVQRSAA